MIFKSLIDICTKNLNMHQDNSIYYIKKYDKNTFKNTLKTLKQIITICISFIVILFISSCTTELDKSLYCGSKSIGSLGGEANSIYDDYYPTINPIEDDQNLHFVRFIKNKAKKVSRKNKDEQELLNVKVFDRDFKISKSNLNLDDDFAFYTTPIIIEYNGRYEVYFAGNKKDKPVNRNIYYGEYNKSTQKIENIKILKEILENDKSKSSFDNAPTISPNGKFLIFASERNDGFGKLDLYYSIRMKDKWSAAKNMGDKFNTKYDDNYPHLDSEMNLYYSSKVENEEYDIEIKGSKKPIKKESKIESKIESKTEIDAKKENVKDTTENEGKIESDNIDSEKTIETNTIETNYDIFVAKIQNANINEIEWNTPNKLTEPINSEYDDICPFIYFDEIILSSNREGGCGGYDMYKFPLCKPFVITGKVVSESNFVATDGILTVYNSEGQVAAELDIDKKGNYKIENLLRDDYTLIYSNECLSDMEMKQKITIPCSEQSITKYIADFVISKPSESFDFGEYDVPFFVSGYYKPNTTENLKELRLLHTSNILGNSDTTMYIENPDEKYDNYAIEIDKAIENAVDFVVKQLSFSSNLCGKKTKLKIKINITGFTDDRGFSEVARYNGPDINDEQIGFSLSSGTKMSNELLALMRAYFSADELLKRLKTHLIYKANAENVIWNIDIGDTNTKKTKQINDKSNELKRKVNLTINIDEIRK